MTVFPTALRTEEYHKGAPSTAGNLSAALSTAAKARVIDALKSTGSTDPDILFAAKQGLLDQYRPLKTMSWVPIICGALLCLTVIGAIGGVPLVLLGWWLRRKCNRNIATVEDGFSEYLSSIGVKAPSVVAA